MYHIGLDSTLVDAKMADCMFARGGAGALTQTVQHLQFSAKAITVCCSPAQAGVGLLWAAEMQYSGLMRLKHFYLLERKVLHLKTSSDTVQIPIKTSGIP